PRRAPSPRGADASVEIVKHVAATVGGVKGMTVDLKVHVRNAAKQQCGVIMIVTDAEGVPVRSAVPKYGVGPEELLAPVTFVTPTSNDDELPVQMFIPFEALPGGPGEHRFGFFIQITVGNRFLLDPPKRDSFKITRR